MVINTSARKHQLLIGGQDWSAALIEVSNWSTSPLDNSGLIKISAALTLIEVRSLPGSLDDRVNPLWRVGQTLTIDVTNSSGVLQRHPCGTLRILSAEYDLEAGKLSVTAGCLLTLLSFKQPTTPDEADIQEPGQYSDRFSLVKRLFAAAGINNIKCPYSIPFPINYPINIQSSYIETAGAMLYSAGFVAWQDRTETIQIKPIFLSGLAAITLQIGNDQGDETYYRRLSSAEGIREIIKVRGVRQVAQIPSYPSQSTTTHYGALGAIIPGAGNQTIVTGIDNQTETYSFGSRKLTTNIVARRSYSLIYPDKEPRSSYLIDSEIRIETRQFETNDEGKLLSVHTVVYKPANVIEAEYIKFKQDQGESFSSGGLIVAEEIRVSYAYDRKNRPTQVQTTKYETEVAILSGIDTDWNPYPLPPIGLIPSEATTETWSNRRGNEWVHTIIGSKSFCRLKPELITDEMPTSQKTGLAADDSVSVREVSNSGQTVPPAPERCPPRANFYDKQVCGEARFSQHGGNPYKERERVYQIEYLAGDRQIESNVDYRERSPEYENCSDSQCALIAQTEGALLFGRFKGQEVQTDLKDEYFNWQPLMRADCIEPDGTVRAFCLDDSHYYLGFDKALANFGAIWIGNGTNRVNTATITTSAIASVGDTQITIQPAPKYIPANTILNINDVEVVTSAAVQIGDTVIAVVQIDNSIPIGASATYTSPVLNLPYERVSTILATCIGGMITASHPYELTSTETNVTITGVGVIIVMTVVAEVQVTWDLMSAADWNNLSSERWNLLASEATWDSMSAADWNGISSENWNLITTG